MIRSRDRAIPLFKRFGVRTFFALVTLPILAVVVTAVSLSALSSTVMRQNVSQRNLQIARRASEEIYLYLQDSFNYLESLADILVPIRDPWVADVILESAALSYGKFKAIHFLSGPETVVASTELENSRAAYDHDVLTTAAENGALSWSEVFVANDRLPYLSVALPVDSAVGPWPMIYAEIRLRNIWDLIDDISFGDSGDAILVSAEKILIAQKDKATVLSVDRSGVDRAGDIPDTRRYYVIDGEDGVPYLAAYDDVPLLGWRIIIIQLLSEAFVPTHIISFISGIVAFLAFLAAIGASYLLVRRYSRPLARLMSGTKIIREGALDHRIQVDREDEFGQLSVSFNSMVTDLEEWSQKLADSERTHRLLTENVNDIIFSIDSHGTILFCNSRAEIVTGYPIEDLCGSDAGDYLARESKALALARLMTGDSEVAIEIVLNKKGGDTVSLEAKLVKTSSADAGIVYYGVARDITERKKAEARLEAYRDELRSLASQLTLAEARERKKIASLIHDRIGQAHSLARIKLGILGSHDLPAESAKIVSELIPALEQIIQETRSLIFTISSPLLYDLGLSAALERLVEQFDEEHNMAFRFSGPLSGPDIDIDVSLLLFDAVKELLVNAVKHSHATTVDVRLQASGKKVHIFVRDNGSGFPKRINGRGGGYGLFSIKERLSDFGGECVLASTNGSGAVINLYAPAKERG